MKVILLSGGSGTRLWPLSNGTRSKQFLRLLDSPCGVKESMIQRVVRQIRSAGVAEEIIVATANSQKDVVKIQLGYEIPVVLEPSRRDTFPAIALACSWIASNGDSMDEPVVVMPCDTFADDAYFETIGKMADAVSAGVADLVLMGVSPTYPSAKYGYIVPEKSNDATFAQRVQRFIEKPDVATAERLIANGAMWNGGVFAFRLGYLQDIVKKYVSDAGYKSLSSQYDRLPQISFDYEVVEKASSVAVVPYKGEWLDLGTWNTLTDKLSDLTSGNVILDGCNETYVINELEIPLVCIGAKDMIVAASPDGIIVSKRKMSENIKHLIGNVDKRPMYEERRWGEYKVIDSVEFGDGFCALTKQLTLNPGCSISYQRHFHRDEVWTFIDGEGEIVLDGNRRSVKRGDVIFIPKGQLHALKAVSSLTFIEVQSGSDLVEEDIERFDYDW